MSDETYYGTPVAPVNHGVMSTTGSVALGTAGGALKSVGKVAMWCIGIGAALGVMASLGWLGSIVGALTLDGAITGGISIGKVLLGLVGGAAVGTGAAALLSVPSAVIGASKGAAQSHERVMAEKGAAHQMQAELQVARYQAMAASNDNKYNLPEQGAAMNMAMPKIEASSIERSGTLAEQQLQRA